MGDAAKPAVIGRPVGAVGEARRVMLQHLREHGPMTMRELAHATQVGNSAALSVMKNAKRNGVLVIVGHDKRAHCKRWVAIYDLAPQTEPAACVPADAPAAGAQGWADLARVMGGWLR